MRLFLVAAMAVCVACGSEVGEAAPRGDGVGDDVPGAFGESTSTSPAETTSGGCVPSKGSVEIAGNGCDDDADGTVDNVLTCDARSTANTADALAQALGICTTAAKDGYGIVKASLTRGFGRTDPPGAGQSAALPRFGSVVKAREGSRIAALSTGWAQEFNGAPGVRFVDGKSWGSGSLPPGFPKAAAGCPQGNAIFDVVALRLEIKAPKNAKGFAFDFDFFTSEWPVYVCSPFNDAFIAYVTSKATTGNISFDAKKNPVSVNNGFFDRCTAGAVMGCDSGRISTSTCPAGPGELAGTGFGLIGPGCNGQPVTSGGATGWLTSQAPISPGETFSIEFIIWDTGDADLDSVVLLDKFRWIAVPITAPSTSRPPA